MNPEEQKPHVEGKPSFMPNSMGIRGTRLLHNHAYNIGGKHHPGHKPRFNDKDVEEALQRRIYTIFG